MVANACIKQPGCFGHGSLGGGVGVLLGNGDGTFSAARSYPAGGWFASAVALGDVNRDGKLDVVVAIRCDPYTRPCSKGGVGVLINVLPALATKTTLSSNSNPSHVNQLVTFTATVAGLYGGQTTGTVTFKQGSVVLGTVGVVGGKATLVHAFAKKGTFVLYAVFSGDSNSKKSISPILKQVVTP